MRHALAIMVLAGMAGGAAWYKFDQSPKSPTAKLQVPDFGPEDELAGSEPAEWKPLDIELMSPVEKLPSRFIADSEPKIQTVSDEQVFATSEEEDAEEAPAPAKRSGRAKTEALEVVETKSKQPTARHDQAYSDDIQSVEGRPISVRKLGHGKYRTLIIAGMDGRDRTAVSWTDDLVEALEARTDLLEQQEFVILRAVNPDGLAAKTRENARGVDLNRNFPTRRFRPIPTEATGIGPASEPETRAILQTMYDVQPQRVVHLCSTSGRSLVVANTQASDVAERLQRQFGLPPEKMNPDRLPGSVEELADATWNSSVVMLQLHGVPEPEIVKKIVPVMISAVAVRETNSYRNNVAPVSTPRKETNRWQNGPTSSPLPSAPAYQPEQRQRPVIRRGYEELPPPPQ